MRIFHLALVLFVTPVAALEVGLISDVAKNSDNLLINGRNISINTGGIGFQTAERFFGKHFNLSVSALFASNGDSGATFSGATVSGPAKLAMTTATIKAYAFPDSRLTPLASYTILNRTGDIDFTGFRNTTPASGAARITYDQKALALGFRFAFSPEASLEMLTGKHQWGLLSNANGSLGAFKVATVIQAGNIDTFNTLALKYKVGGWVYAGEYGSYELSADNKTLTTNLKMSVCYEF